MKPPIYYNERDPRKAAWLRELIHRDLIAPGDVDERDILDVIPAELVRYTQCHFFAGVGAWSYALRRAGWPDDRRVWTGSCPCQPFSAAGPGAGFADERHLWPAWFHLIGQCQPPVVLGEQVESDDAKAWLDLVHDDLEALDYAVGPLVLPAAGFGAPHGRHRIFFVAESGGGRRPSWEQFGSVYERDESGGGGTRDRGVVGVMDHAAFQGSQGQPSPGTSQGRTARRPGPVGGFWADAEWLPCRDGKLRPVEPGTFPLAHGTPARVGRLCGYGDAIVVPAAEGFIRAYLDAS